MARRPTKTLAKRARQAQAEADPPIRFVEDYRDVTIPVTIAYKAGKVLDEPRSDLRRRAHAMGKAVEVR
jgi:hypothetical protein